MWIVIAKRTGEERAGKAKSYSAFIAAADGVCRYNRMATKPTIERMKKEIEGEFGRLRWYGYPGFGGFPRATDYTKAVARLPVFTIGGGGGGAGVDAGVDASARHQRMIEV